MAMPMMRSIAMVDDDVDVRESLAELIEVLGIRCVAFAGCGTFLAAHRPGLFDCLVTDIQMSGGSGLELQERLAVLDPDLPVIVVTSSDRPVVRQRALRLGARAFLTKPVAAATMVERLEQMLGPLASDPGSPR